ncbi:MAG TPA: trypsin-like peptidase domain-containing protein [Gemmatimonadota bacterium]|nr:trypsin-like peptidase domain-containing protein [Gemmatimonadota bacterium]
MRLRKDILVVAALALSAGAGAAWWADAIRSTPGSDGPLSEAVAQTPSQSIDVSRRNAIVTASEVVGPAVVSVNVVATQVVRERSVFDDPFMDPFFRGLFPPRERQRQVQGLGSGFIVSPDGYIVTNQHVVAGATEIVVTLLDGRQLPAELVEADEVTDIAVLRIDADDLPTVRLGNSDNLLIGEWAIAIGNPFGYLLADRNPSVTVGVISAIGRDVRPEPGEGRPQIWSGMIQTDAAINPGNSGGPLVNAAGEVIGVNAFIFSGASGGSIGLGFAIPINRARRVLQDIVELGTIRRPWIGIHLAPVQADGNAAPVGARVIRVDPGSPAERAGIEPGDILAEANGRPLQSPIEWEGRLLDLPTGARLDVVVRRDGSTFERTLTPEDDPLRQAARIETPYGASIVVLTPTLASHLGLTTQDGLYLESVDADSGFRRLGLREGDVLVALGSERLDGADDAERLIAFLRSGQRATLFVERDGQMGRVEIR